MIILRSAVFNLLFYVNFVLLLLAALPTLLMPRRGILGVAKLWARINLWLLRVVCDVKVEWRGTDKIPPGPLIVGAKHQSFWETFALLPLFRDPTFIMKRELMWIPLFGWYTWKGGMIAIDRSARATALRTMETQARAALNSGRQIIVFPEGTRRAPGAEAKYKHGIARIYAAGSAPCLPVALNSGLFWPRRRFLRHPGTIRVEFLDPIPPGLDREAFATRLQHDIETATARLVAEGERDLHRMRAGSLAAI